MASRIKAAVLQIEQNERLKQAHVVSEYFYSLDSYTITVVLENDYEGVSVTSKILLGDWTAHLYGFKEKLRSEGVVDDHINLICDNLWEQRDLIHDNVNARLKAVSKSIAKLARDGEDDDEGAKKPKLYLRKYTANGTLPLHESAIIQGQPVTFLTLTEAGEFQYIPYIDGAANRYYPKPDTIETQNPVPYIFESTAELNEYLELAKATTFGQLFTMVKLIFKKYVNVEDHYATVIVAGIIASHFYDKFATTHYDFFTGDNNSGKNSALLLIKWLAYRVFYGTATSAPNYYGFLGDIEEGQGCIAEDEAEDIGYNLDKNKILKSGYCAGDTVTKTDLSNGRKQTSYNSYCPKWFAMEEIPDYKNIKGILDRSFVYHFVIGNVQYNIKDVLRGAGDPKFKKLFDEILHARKLLFLFRLLHYGDSVPDISLNIKHRNEEHAKPLLRLFSYRNDASEALKEIRLALSKFILGRNEARKNSREAVLRDAALELVSERKTDSTKFKGTKDFFTNPIVFAKVQDLMDGEPISNKKAAFYTIEHGEVSHKQIGSLYRSKLKARPGSEKIDSKTYRGFYFQAEWLERLGLYYDVPEVIKFVDKDGNEVEDAVTEVTMVTEVTGFKGMEGPKNDQSHAQNRAQKDQKDTEKDPPTPPNIVTTVTTVTEAETGKSDIERALKDRYDGKSVSNDQKESKS